MHSAKALKMGEKEDIQVLGERVLTQAFFLEASFLKNIHWVCLTNRSGHEIA